MAGFMKVGDITGLTGYWIAHQGNQWDASTEGGWFSYDANFNLLSRTRISDVGQIRGISFDSKADQLVMYDFDHRYLLRVSLNGHIMSRIFDSGNSQINGVSVDPRDSTLWLARFGGEVDHVTAKGKVLGRFAAGFNLSGIAIDPVQNSVFLMRADGPEVPAEGGMIMFMSSHRPAKGSAWS
jgi:hypothetical protein